MKLIIRSELPVPFGGFQLPEKVGEVTQCEVDKVMKKDECLYA